jgi:hypothetical protein
MNGSSVFAIKSGTVWDLMANIQAKYRALIASEHDAAGRTRIIINGDIGFAIMLKLVLAHTCTHTIQASQDRTDKAPAHIM